jgi:hypothetical protein
VKVDYAAPAIAKIRLFVTETRPVLLQQAIGSVSSSHSSYQPIQTCMDFFCSFNDYLLVEKRWACRTGHHEVEVVERFVNVEISIDFNGGQFCYICSAFVGLSCTTNS